MITQDTNSIDHILSILCDIIYDILPESFDEHVMNNGSVRWYIGNVTIQVKRPVENALSLKLSIYYPTYNKHVSIPEWHKKKWIFTNVEEVQQNKEYIEKEIIQILAL